MSALLASALGVLLWMHARRQFGLQAATVAIVLYTTSALVFGWMTTVKTYALSALLLFAAFVILDRAVVPLRAGLAGLALGIGIDTRLLLVGAVPAFLVYLLFRSAGRARLVASFTVGLAVGVLPSAGAFAVGPTAFRFDNLGAEAFRSSGGLVGDMSQKAKTIANLFGYGATDHWAAAQFVLLVLFAVAAVATTAWGKPSLSVLVVLFMAITSLLPTPAYTQYFAVIIPILIVTCLGCSRIQNRFMTAGISSAIIIYVLAGAYDYKAYLGPNHFAGADISAVEGVATVIQAHTVSGEEIMVSWPGYLVGTHARAVPGFEDHFSPRTATYMSPALRHRLHFLTPHEIEQLIIAHRARLAVFRTWSTVEPRPDWPDALRHGRWREIGRVVDAGIYQAP